MPEELSRKAKRFRSEAALLRQSEGFRLFVEAVQDYAIFMLDVTGLVASWNAGAQRLKGYTASEIIGKHFSTFYPEADILDGKPERELEIATKTGRLEDEGWRIRKDGSRFWANVVITALRDDAGNLIGFGKVMRDFTERLRAFQTLQDARQQLQDSENSLRELSRHLLRTQDEERRRIGRELHDSLGQYLSALKMRLDSVHSEIPQEATQIKQAIAECCELAEQSTKEIRTVSYLLYPPMLEQFGLNSAIQWYVEGFTKRSGIETSVEIPPNFGRLDPDAELALFRVLQESLTNVLRHSGSATAAVILRKEGESAVLEVSDRGKGMPSQLEQSRQDWLSTLGVGLRGMNERVRQLSGTLELSSSSQGTIVTARIPIGENNRT